MTVYCVYCGNAIESEARLTYRQMTGWAQNRDAGGVNALALREPLDRYACTPCIDKLKRGIPAEQMQVA